VITVKQHVELWLDGQISVKDGLFLQGARSLLFLPFLPFFIVSFAFEAGSLPMRLIVLGGLLVCIPWGFLVFKVRRKKKDSWVEPTRWTDQNNGY
jgi:hypothetical protein